jgi:hypothetical protein
MASIHVTLRVVVVVLNLLPAARALLPVSAMLQSRGMAFTNVSV